MSPAHFVGIALFGIMLAIIVLTRRAPLGWEDATGFHTGDEPAPRPLTRLNKHSRRGDAEGNGSVRVQHHDEATAA